MGTSPRTRQRQDGPREAPPHPYRGFLTGLENTGYPFACRDVSCWCALPRRRLVGPVNAINGVAQIEGARTQRFPFPAGHKSALDRADVRSSRRADSNRAIWAVLEMRSVPDQVSPSRPTPMP